MTGLFMKKSLVKNIKELGPALAILLSALVISTFITEFTFTFGFNAIWKTFFRFLRLSALLCLPILYLLIPGGHFEPEDSAIASGAGGTGYRHPAP